MDDQLETEKHEKQALKREYSSLARQETERNAAAEAQVTQKPAAVETPVDSGAANDSGFANLQALLSKATASVNPHDTGSNQETAQVELKDEKSEALVEKDS